MDTNVFRNTKPARALLAGAIAGLVAHVAYALVGPYVGLDRHYSTWAFYCLALMVLAAGVARAGLVQDERRAWTAGAGGGGGGVIG